MLEIIKPGTKFDFIGKRAYFFALSGTIIGASLIAWLVLGLNLGIEFKGGTKVIVAFAADQEIDRGAISAAVDDLVQKETGEAGTQVEVQDFGTGVGAGEGEEAQKFVLYTELTSLLSQERRNAVAAELVKRFGEKTTVDTPESAGDVFYLRFPEEAPIGQRAQELVEFFQAPPFNFTGVTVVSDKEREIEVDYVRDLNLLETEAEAAGGDPGADTSAAAERKAFEERKAAMLSGLTDTRFTVTVEELRAKLTQALQAQFQGSFVGVESSTIVSPSVGSDLFAEALLALLYAIIGILIYVALRFDIRFAPGAIIALLHDGMAVLGVFAIFQIKFTMPIIAAVLTIVGYSINDTIVIFDRIRENAGKRSGLSLAQLINVSVNETLGRTILTSGATLLTVIAILILGGGLIWDFALALLVGMISGVYSTVYIATPVALYIDNFLIARAAQRKAAR